MSKQEIRQKLSEFLQQYYDGSFSRMACDYIHATGMTEEEVPAFLESMKGVVINKQMRVCQFNTLAFVF